jgi:hypothetical protein
MSDPFAFMGTGRGRLHPEPEPSRAPTQPVLGIEWKLAADDSCLVEALWALMCDLESVVASDAGFLETVRYCAAAQGFTARLTSPGCWFLCEERGAVGVLTHDENRFGLWVRTDGTRLG